MGSKGRPRLCWLERTNTFLWRSVGARSELSQINHPNSRTQTDQQPPFMLCISFNKVCLLHSLQFSCRRWVVRRTLEDFQALDRQLHTCVYDRKFSQLPTVPQEENIASNGQPHKVIKLWEAAVNDIQKGWIESPQAKPVIPMNFRFCGLVLLKYYVNISNYSCLQLNRMQSKSPILHINCLRVDLLLFAIHKRYTFV